MTLPITTVIGRRLRFAVEVKLLSQGKSRYTAKTKKQTNKKQGRGRDCLSLLRLKMLGSSEKENTEQLRGS